MARLILASKSPRRKELLHLMRVPFEIKTREVDESVSNGLPPEEAVRTIAAKKALSLSDVAEETVILAADTIVVLDNQIIGKPKDRREAERTLTALSGRRHSVITACALLHKQQLEVFHETTYVQFAPLTGLEISDYIDVFEPFDKAGSYGIQEWLGVIGIDEIQGSYHNVMGLPTSQLYRKLKKYEIQMVWGEKNDL